MESGYFLEILGKGLRVFEGCPVEIPKPGSECTFHRYRQRSKVAGHCGAGRYAGEYAEGRDEVGEPSSLSVTGMSGGLACRPDCRLSDETNSTVGKVHSDPGFSPLREHRPVRRLLQSAGSAGLGPAVRRAGIQRPAAGRPVPPVHGRASHHKSEGVGRGGRRHSRCGRLRPGNGGVDGVAGTQLHRLRHVPVGHGRSIGRPEPGQGVPRATGRDRCQRSGPGFLGYAWEDLGTLCQRVLAICRSVGAGRCKQRYRRLPAGQQGVHRDRQYRRWRGLWRLQDDGRGHPHGGKPCIRDACLAGLDRRAGHGYVASSTGRGGRPGSSQAFCTDAE